MILHAYYVLGPGSGVYHPWCPKCVWSVAHLEGKSVQPAAYAAAAEIWLRSWRYTMPVYTLDAVSPLPEWAFQYSRIGMV